MFSRRSPVHLVVQAPAPSPYRREQPVPTLPPPTRNRAPVALAPSVPGRASGDRHGSSGKPCSDQSPVVLGAASPTLPVPPRPRVVVVDDHPRMRWAVRQLLEADGFLVAGEAGDGPSGVKMTLRQAPDVLVVDWRLPRLDGLTVAAQVRAALPEIRVVLFTAEPVRGDRLLFGGGSVDAVVAKGCPPQELLTAVRGSTGGELA